ncbi:MAG: phosphatase PAP2 family protein [Clostridia bacterium]|nr:phosphatase PAP2 family protein [Clostridia bacterium]
MKKTKKFYNSLAISLFLVVATLVVGTIFDLQISNALADLTVGKYHSENLFATIFECIGEDVLYLFLLCAFAILFFYFLRNPLKKSWINVSLLIILCVSSIICSFYGLNKTLNYISIYTDFGLDSFVANIFGKLAIIGFSISISILIFFIFGRLKKEMIVSLTGFALAVLIVAGISNGIVQGSKLIFDRTRYRAMIYEGYTNFEYYTNWFIINTNKFSSTSTFYSDFFKSFPSGHTCAAASTFLLILLPNFLQKVDTKKWKVFFYSFASIYTLIVALSRLIGGAHFFTDVFIGGMVTVASVLIVKWFFVEKLKFLQKKIKHNQNKTQLK